MGSIGATRPTEYHTVMKNGALKSTCRGKSPFLASDREGIIEMNGV